MYNLRIEVILKKYIFLVRTAKVIKKQPERRETTEKRLALLLRIRNILLRRVINYQIDK